MTRPPSAGTLATNLCLSPTATSHEILRSIGYGNKCSMMTGGPTEKTESFLQKNRGRIEEVTGRNYSEHSALQCTSIASSTLSKPCFLAISCRGIGKDCPGSLGRNSFPKSCSVTSNKSWTRAQGSWRVFALSGLILGLA